MSDQSEQPSGGSAPHDPWAPPERKTSLDKQTGPPESVHDQHTVLGIPGLGQGAGQAPGAAPAAGPTPPSPYGNASGAVPPPPTAPGGPAQAPPGAYGYPGIPPQATQGFQQPGSPYGPGPGPGPGPGAGPGYGYPAYPAAPGYPGYPGQGQNPWQQPPANGLGTAALVLGIISVVGFCLWGLNIVIGILALVFGIIGRRRAGRGEATNGGMALAGIILGIVGIVIGTMMIGLTIVGFIADVEENSGSSDDDPFATSLVVGADR
ncbi:DUF4190 domain-containing protein [Streptomyces paludis]|uniref:DUF4190 domain-containing protein n=1 Tax=Streptomyces paludis TaxID=2282738 RepID=A0A345HV49_9ACTN|nr:DUF4190 domain-containing protein [Streptomyces paludis]AXG80573.1 DUF4190 domain-containing protein [Streptomyces paludis]